PGGGRIRMDRRSGRAANLADGHCLVDGRLYLPDWYSPNLHRNRRVGAHFAGCRTAVARIVFGRGVGGSAAFMVEYAPLNRRGFIGSFQQVSTGAGFFFGSLFGLIVTSTTSDQTIFSWAWRLPFLSGILLGVVGVYMRLRLEDTPEFQALKQRSGRSVSPLIESLRSQWTGVTVAFGYNVIQSVG